MQGKRCFFRRVAKALVILLFLSFSLYGEDVSDIDREHPSWILLEKGRSFFADKELATALNYFILAKEREVIYPEAEYWIGRVFEEEGELILAEEQYLKALEMARFLYITEDRFEIKYRLADIYLKKGDMRGYESELLSIIEEEIEFDIMVQNREQQYIRVITEEGLDELLFLYREKNTFSLKALSELGAYYYNNGQYRSSIIKNLYAIMTIYTVGIDELLKYNDNFEYPRDLEMLIEKDEQWYIYSLETQVQQYDSSFYFIREDRSNNIVDKEESIESALSILEENGADFIFSGADYCLDKFKSSQPITRYINSSYFYQTLYYLASSLFAEGYEESSFQIWTLLANQEEDSYWKNLAVSQLIDPIIAPVSGLY